MNSRPLFYAVRMALLNMIANPATGEIDHLSPTVTCLLRPP